MTGVEGMDGRGEDLPRPSVARDLRGQRGVFVEGDQTDHLNADRDPEPPHVPVRLVEPSPLSSRPPRRGVPAVGGRTVRRVVTSD